MKVFRLLISALLFLSPLTAFAAIAQAGGFTTFYRDISGGSLSNTINYNSGASVVIIELYDQQNTLCTDITSPALSTGTLIKYDCNGGDGGSNYIFYAVSPTGTSGTFTATAGTHDVYVHEGAYSGTHLTTPIQQDNFQYITANQAITWSPTGVPSGSVAFVQSIFVNPGGTCPANQNLSCIASSFLSSDFQGLMDSTSFSLSSSPTISTVAPGGLSFGHFYGVILQPPVSAASFNFWQFMSF